MEVGSMTTDQGAAVGTPEADAERAKRKRRAFLAVGLVVGLGVGATLAVFSTNVFGSATFATGDWGIEASFDGGTTWLAPNAGSSDINGTFAFPLPLPNIVPDEPVYAPISVRTTLPSQYPADFKFLSVTNAGAVTPLYDNLTLSISQTSTCDEVGFGTAAAGWPTGVAFPAATPSTVLPVPEAQGTPLDLCLQVVLPAAADRPETRGQTANVMFNFNAVAVIPAD
jgi:hypothetical protein